jgi:hypothetical protein
MIALITVIAATIIPRHQAQNAAVCTAARPSGRLYAVQVKTKARDAEAQELATAALRRATAIENAAVLRNMAAEKMARDCGEDAMMTSTEERINAPLLNTAHAPGKAPKLVAACL